MNVELVRARTADGMSLDGALHEPRGVGHSGLDGALLLHGVGSNFYQPRLLEELADGLAARGMRTIRANTRGHDTIHTVMTDAGVRRQGAALELVDECRLDIDAWLVELKSRGCRQVLLAGHSLGAIKSVYWQVHRAGPLVAALAAFSPPRLSAESFREGDGSERYLASLAEARQRAAAGREQELLEVNFPFPMAMSAATFIDKYGGERYNVAQLAPKLSCPSLFTYAERELGQPAFLHLADQIRAAGQQAPIQVEILSGADHSYRGHSDRLLAAVDRHLTPHDGPQKP